MQTDDGFDTEKTENPEDVRGTRVQFHVKAVMNEAKSWGITEQHQAADGSIRTVTKPGAGRPIFEDTEYIRIFIPGDKTSIVDRPVEERDRRVYAAQYRAWKENRDQDLASGTPLSAVPWLTPALVETARYFEIRTIEQLAALSDASLQRLGAGWTELRQRAKDYVATADGNAPLEAARAENRHLASKIAALEDQIAKLAKRAEKARD